MCVWVLNDESLYNRAKSEVSTKWNLLANRSCCGLGCRECPFDPRGEKGTSRVRPVFQVERGHHGFAVAISAGDEYILHLSPGTTRNEAVIQKLVNVINAAICGMLENK